MLAPDKFLRGLFRKKWRLADGAKIPKSEYRKLMLGNESVSPERRLNLPNLGGVFLRGVNNNNGRGKHDPDIRNAGDYQSDTIKKHHHTYNSKIDSATCTVICGKGNDKVFFENIKRGNTIETPNAIEETRPKNIAVYFYIKIN